VTADALAELDHVVVAAATLEAGAAWCAATFGVAPDPGGRHAFQGTHNRLLAIGSPRFPRSYLEIIAVDPDAPPPGRPRWFGLDDPRVRRAIAAGPRLVHWVARTRAGVPIEAARDALRAAGHDPGTPHAAERATADGGRLRWTITLDGGVERPAVPLLIAWDAGARHPALALPDRGVALERFALGGTAASLAARLGAETGAASGAPLVARFASPRGAVELAGV
jgi:hypothetical protein